MGVGFGRRPRQNSRLRIGETVAFDVSQDETKSKSLETGSASIFAVEGIALRRKST